MLSHKRDSMFPKQFTPGYIGKLWIKNRLVKAPLATCYSTLDGCVTERIIRHYREVARGGAGLIIVEYAYVDDKASKSGFCQLGISSNEHRPGLQWLATTIKANGARACLQLEHAGREKFLGVPPIKAPSRIPWEGVDPGAPVPEELTFEEIGEIAKAFGDAALRAQQAGFEMVEVHGAHGYLITNFLSPLTNLRGDWYGGSLKNRMRFLLDVIANIRNKVGLDYPLSVRISASDYQEGGITIEESQEVARALEKAGVNVIHVSGGDHYAIDYEQPPMYRPPGTHIWAAELIKSSVNIPVIVGGAINTPELAEKTLEDGKADFISMARPILADPFLPLKSREGRPEDINPCIRCADCVGPKGNTRGGTNCAVNVAVGKEDEFRITRAATPRRVAVVGGGPAGMEAARVAALKGHKVTLFEKRKLGGMLIEASVPEFKAELRRLIYYLSTQVRKTGVEVTNSEATVKSIKDGKFDAVIVATGAMPWIQDVPGVNKPFVVGALDILRGTKIGKNVIVVGGGRIGCDVALFIAEQGQKVIITTRKDNIALDMNHNERPAFLHRLSRQDVEIRAGVHLGAITDNGIILHDRSGIKSEIKGDTVVLASGMRPTREVFDELVQMGDLDVCAVGDCVEPRDIFDAIHEGYYAAYMLD